MFKIIAVDLALLIKQNTLQNRTSLTVTADNQKGDFANITIGNIDITITSEENGLKDQKNYSTLYPLFSY